MPTVQRSFEQSKKAVIYAIGLGEITNGFIHRCIALLTLFVILSMIYDTFLLCFLSLSDP